MLPPSRLPGIAIALSRQQERLAGNSNRQFNGARKTHHNIWTIQISSFTGVTSNVFKA
jgi:hypothetical protein